MIILLFLFLPYIWFGNQLYIGGDDTRLFYIYPFEWINNLALYSRFNLSSLGANNTQYHLLPLLNILSMFEKYGIPGFVIQNLVFSSILIIGFYFLYRFFSECLENKYRFESIIGSLFFTLSPIVLLMQYSVFLYSIWLIPGISCILYFGLIYVKYGSKLYLLLFSLISVIFSVGFASIPRFIGFFGIFIPLLIIFFLFNKKIKYLYKLIVLIIVFIFSQSFWIVPFFGQILDSESFVSHSTSQEIKDSFKITVDAVTPGNDIFYPIMNLFHYSIQKNWNWPSLELYDNFYNKLIVLNIIYFVSVFLGIFYLKSIKDKLLRNYFIFSFIGFLILLYFFTINIGFLKDVFLYMGKIIPGFGMFRNFYDKFALGYVLFYSFLIYVSLVLIGIKLQNKRKYIFITFIIILLLNSFIFFKGSIYHTKLRQTENIEKKLIIQNEYLDFIKKLNEGIVKNKRILIIPYGISSYSYIIGETENNIFAGRSPIELFTTFQDISGRLSFRTNIASDFENLLLNKNYEGLKDFFVMFNIGYILYYPNLPDEFLKSYLFDQNILAIQDQDFKKNIFGELLINSEKGNYQLYKIKEVNPNLFEFKDGDYEKINNIKYYLSLKNINNDYIIFKDNFSEGWKLYLGKNEGNIFNFDNFIYFKKSLFNNKHEIVYDYANFWQISKDEIINYVDMIYGQQLQKEGYPKDLENGKKDYKYYTLNPDGTIDFELTLYFKPQSYFYLGLIISGTTFVLLILFLIYEFISEKFRK